MKRHHHHHQQQHHPLLKWTPPIPLSSITTNDHHDNNDKQQQQEQTTTTTTHRQQRHYYHRSLYSTNGAGLVSDDDDKEYKLNIERSNGYPILYDCTAKLQEQQQEEQVETTVASKTKTTTTNGNERNRERGGTRTSGGAIRTHEESMNYMQQLQQQGLDVDVARTTTTNPPTDLPTISPTNSPTTTPTTPPPATTKSIEIYFAYDISLPSTSNITNNIESFESNLLWNIVKQIDLYKCDFDEQNIMNTTSVDDDRRSRRSLRVSSSSVVLDNKRNLGDNDNTADTFIVALGSGKEDFYYDEDTGSCGAAAVDDTTICLPMNGYMNSSFVGDDEDVIKQYIIYQIQYAMNTSHVLVDDITGVHFVGTTKRTEPTTTATTRASKQNGTSYVTIGVTLGISFVLFTMLVLLVVKRKYQRERNNTDDDGDDISIPSSTVSKSNDNNYDGGDDVYALPNTATQRTTSTSFETHDDQYSSNDNNAVDHDNNNGQPPPSSLSGAAFVPVAVQRRNRKKKSMKKRKLEIQQQQLQKRNSASMETITEDDEDSHENKSLDERDWLHIDGDTDNSSSDSDSEDRKIVVVEDDHSSVDLISLPESTLSPVDTTPTGNGYKRAFSPPNYNTSPNQKTLDGNDGSPTANDKHSSHSFFTVPWL